MTHAWVYDHGNEEINTHYANNDHAADPADAKRNSEFNSDSHPEFAREANAMTMKE